MSTRRKNGRQERQHEKLQAYMALKATANTKPSQYAIEQMRHKPYMVNHKKEDETC